MPTRAHQIARLYERSLQSHLGTGGTSMGHAFLHNDDRRDAFVSTVERRNQLSKRHALPLEVLKRAFSTGVGLPWNLALCMLIGLSLMFSRIRLGHDGGLAKWDQLIAAMVITMAGTAMAAVARPVRWLIIPTDAQRFANGRIRVGVSPVSALSDQRPRAKGIAALAIPDPAIGQECFPAQDVHNPRGGARPACASIGRPANIPSMWSMLRM